MTDRMSVKCPCRGYQDFYEAADIDATRSEKGE